MCQLHELGQEAGQQNGNLACMMIDADRFKSINDTYGHDAGDRVLKRPAQELQHSVRSVDFKHSSFREEEWRIVSPVITDYVKAPVVFLVKEWSMDQLRRNGCLFVIPDPKGLKHRKKKLS